MSSWTDTSAQGEAGTNADALGNQAAEAATFVDVARHAGDRAVVVVHCHDHYVPATSGLNRGAERSPAA